MSNDQGSQNAELNNNGANNGVNIQNSNFRDPHSQTNNPFLPLGNNPQSLNPNPNPNPQSHSYTNPYSSDWHSGNNQFPTSNQATPTNPNTGNPNYFTEQMMGQMQELMANMLGVVNVRIDNVSTQLQVQSDELKAAVVNNQLIAEENERKADRRFQAIEQIQEQSEQRMKAELEEMAKKLQVGTALARRANDKTLWMRGYPTDQRGYPISLNPWRNTLPPAFFQWVQRVENTGQGNFKVSIRSDAQCTYYKLGVLLAKHDAAFRVPMPNFDTRTLREIQTGVPRQGNRYYREERDIELLENLAVDYSLEEQMADGRSQNLTTNFG